MQVILIDARNAMFRFGWAHRTLRSVDRVPTGAIYGILDLLLRLKAKFRDAQFVMVWDGENKDKGWRRKLYPEYQSNRRKTDKPKEIVAALSQIDRVRQLTRLMDIPNVEVERVEADDIIGILACRCLKKKWTPIVYSSDKDFVQLMPRGVLLIRSGVGLENAKSVHKLFGCAPEVVLKVRAIAGDTSDGIPGIQRGVGPKKALAMLQAGFDPSQVGTEALQRAARRNYRLMRIPTRCGSVVYDSQTQSVLLETVAGVMAQLAHGGDRGSYKGFVSILARLGLAEAMAARSKLWRIQG